jgi:putative transposase
MRECRTSGSVRGVPSNGHPYRNLLERLNEEIKRRTHVVRIFPNAESCLRLVRALAVETHENWLEQHRYLNMDDLREHKKEGLRPVPPDRLALPSGTVLAR